MTAQVFNKVMCWSIRSAHVSNYDFDNVPSLCMHMLQVAFTCQLTMLYIVVLLFHNHTLTWYIHGLPMAYHDWSRRAAWGENIWTSNWQECTVLCSVFVFKPLLAFLTFRDLEIIFCVSSFICELIILYFMWQNTPIAWNLHSLFSPC